MIKSTTRPRFTIAARAVLAVILVAGCAASPAAPSPSLEPTIEPSLAPTFSPTSAPTSVPTSAPTVPPTAAPSDAPSAAPTGPQATPGADGLVFVKSQVSRAPATTAEARRAAAAINAFALQLYRELREPGKGLVFSPTSIALALSMARAGARGETASQMDEVLRNVATDANAGWMNALDLALSKRSGTFKDDEGKDATVTLKIANSSFGQLGYPIEQAYLDALAARFAAGQRLVDFKVDPDAAREIINAWVNEQTAKRIPQLLAQPDITTGTRLVLVNAIYLQAPWQRPFEVEATRPAVFRRADGTQVTVPTMVNGDILQEKGYASGSGWRAAELPYIGGQLAMTLIVPDNLAGFEASLTPGKLAAIIGALRPRPVEIWLPKFGLETKAQLAEPLASMGMPVAFDPAAADFTGIANPAVTGEPGLYIAKVIHQANIDVDEKGTEAAAATAVVMDTGGGPEKYATFRADRPFLFLLRDVSTGAILFMGRVMDPSAR